MAHLRKMRRACTRSNFFRYPSARRLLRKFGTLLSEDGWEPSGNQRVCRKMRVGNARMRFGRIFLRGAVLRTTFKGWERAPAFSNIVRDCSVEFIIAWWPMAVFRSADSLGGPMASERSHFSWWVFYQPDGRWVQFSGLCWAG